MVSGLTPCRPSSQWCFNGPLVAGFETPHAMFFEDLLYHETVSSSPGTLSLMGLMSAGFPDKSSKARAWWRHGWTRRGHSATANTSLTSQLRTISPSALSRFSNGRVQSWHDIMVPKFRCDALSLAVVPQLCSVALSRPAASVQQRNFLSPTARPSHRPSRLFIWPGRVDVKRLQLSWLFFANR